MPSTSVGTGSCVQHSSGQHDFFEMEGFVLCNNQATGRIGLIIFAVRCFIVLKREFVSWFRQKANVNRSNNEFRFSTNVDVDKLRRIAAATAKL